VDRKDALSLLKDLISAFESMDNSPVVSISESGEEGQWKLSVKWSCTIKDKIRLRKLVSKRDLTVKEANGYTIFQ
jgi:hypothetical protein